MAEPIAEEMSSADNPSTSPESGVGADGTPAVGDSELPAHGPILAARSPVFAAMLRHDTREAQSRRIEISDTDEAVLKQLLQFIYTDTAPQLDSVAGELLSASDKYDLPVLKKRCEQALARGLTVDNAAATAVLAELHSRPLLKRAAVDFVARHPKVMATEGWKNAMRDNVDIATEICSLVAAASSENRGVSEDENDKLAQSLVEAAKCGKVEDVRKLLAAGAPIDARDGTGHTALLWAVINGHVHAARCLVYAGADVNVKNFIQRTPLHYAAQKGCLDIMWLLLGASANVMPQDDRGQTPMQWAKESRNTQIEQVLQFAGGWR